MEEISARLVELEVRYAHQSQLLDELNDELVVANQRIERLERELSSFGEMIKGMAPSIEESPDE